MQRPSIADGFVLGAAVALVIGSGMAFWSPPGHATHVEIHAPGHATQRVSLTVDRHIDVDGSRGASSIEIRNGHARFVASACAGKICLLSGWLTRAGDTAMCLPNGVTLQLAGDRHRYDSINY